MKRKDGLYLRGRVYWMTYKGERESTGTDNLKLAEQIRAKWIAEVVEEKWFDKKKTAKYTINDILDYLDTLKIKTHTEKWRKTTEKYRRFWEEQIGGELLKSIEKENILSAMDALSELAPQTQKHYLNYLKAAYKLFIEDKRLQIQNPCNISIVVNNKRRRYLSKEEETKLLDAAEGRLNGDLQDLINIAIHTGLRKMELLHLKSSNIDFENDVITLVQSKTNTPKTIPMHIMGSDAVRQIMLKRRGVNNYIFHASNGKPYLPSNLDRDFWRALKEAKIDDFKWHDLRHTCGSRLAQAGVDTLVIAHVLGHEDLESTKRYAHLNVESVKYAIKKAFNF